MKICLSVAYEWPYNDGLVIDGKNEIDLNTEERCKVLDKCCNAMKEKLKEGYNETLNQFLQWFCTCGCVDIENETSGKLDTYTVNLD